jgi:beta-galactosidase
VPFVDGLNVLEARGRSGIRELSDRADVRFFYRAANLADPKVPFRELAINVGSSAQYTDAAGLVWEADQPYVAGSWGYIGGAAAENTQNLLDSADDPLFQSSRQGLSQYRLDVPEGRYEVELRFAESRFQTPGERVFSVSINEKLEIGDLDLVKNQGFLRAFAQTSQVDVVAGQGLVITFNASRGESILGALRIKKLK